MSEHNGYERKGTYTIDEVLDHVSLNYNDDPETVKFGRIEVFLGSKRYQNFKLNYILEDENNRKSPRHIRCSEKNCGLEGTFFALERHHGQDTSKFHFNLYGYNAKGEEVMLTKDHREPKSRGGSDGLHNLRVMCAPCNSKKGDRYRTSDQKECATRLEALTEASGVLTEASKSLKKLRQKTVRSCPHDVRKTATGKAKCSICGIKLGMYCAKSPDKCCYYNTELKSGKYIVTLITGDNYTVSGRTKKKHEDESEARCVFCTLPKKRK